MTFCFISGLKQCLLCSCGHQASLKAKCLGCHLLEGSCDVVHIMYIAYIIRASITSVYIVRSVHSVAGVYVSTLLVDGFCFSF